MSDQTCYVARVIVSDGTQRGGVLARTEQRCGGIAAGLGSAVAEPREMQLHDCFEVKISGFVSSVLNITAECNH